LAPTIPAPGKLKQEELKFKTNLHHTRRPPLKKTETKKDSGSGLEVQLSGTVPTQHSFGPRFFPSLTYTHTKKHITISIFISVGVYSLFPKTALTCGYFHSL
jgi:hypothetical protein